MIFCFSGNGNTRLIADRLSHIIGHEVTHLRGDLLLHPSTNDITIAEGEDIIWMFPVYSWGIPPVVRNFIDNIRLHISKETRHHMVATMGDDAGLTDKMWRKLMTDKGWNPVSAQGVIMPNTYTLMKGFDIDPKDIAADKIKAALHSIDAIADTIRSGKSVTNIHRGSFAWIKSRLIYPSFVKYAISPCKFHVHECISCGKCAKNCPMDNIIMTEIDGITIPVWGNKCAMCLGCYNVCPRHAVEYSSATYHKGQYFCDRDMLK